MIFVLSFFKKLYLSIYYYITCNTILNVLILKFQTKKHTKTAKNKEILLLHMTVFILLIIFLRILLDNCYFCVV